MASPECMDRGEMVGGGGRMPRGKWVALRQKTEVIRQVFFGDFFHDLFTGHWHLIVGVFSTPVSRAVGAIGGIFARRSSHHFASIEKECGST